MQISGNNQLNVPHFPINIFSVREDTFLETKFKNYYCFATCDLELHELFYMY